MKKLLVLFVLLFGMSIFVSKLLHVNAFGGPCTPTELCEGCPWAPSEWEPLTYSYDYYYDNYVQIGQEFMWNDQHLQEFNNLNAYYQYEIRRDKEVWDYFRCSPSGGIDIVGSYWTNLPNPTDMWTEESDEYCNGGDEEFELKLKDKHGLQANKWYYVVVELERDNEDVGTEFTLRSKSEYCVSSHWALPWCSDYKYCYMGIIPSARA